MAARFAGFDSMGGIKSAWSTITDTSLRFYDMQDFQRRLKTEPIHPITERLRGSGLVEAAGFPVAVQAPELILECINNYNPDTKQILLPDQSVLISIDRQAVVNCLRIPEREEFSDLTVGGAMSEFSSKKMIWRKEIMSS